MNARRKAKLAERTDEDDEDMGNCILCGAHKPRRQLEGRGHDDGICQRCLTVEPRD